MPALHARVEAEVAAMQDSDPEREGDLACSVCGDRIRRQKQIDFLLQGTGAPRKHRHNTYIQIGLRDFGGALQRPINHRVADLKKLPKELAESVAVVEYCRRMLRSWDMDARRVVWVDCCSGVGLTSLLLSLAFPESRVIALDKISSFAVANHTEPGGSVEYMECDLFSDAAVAKINDEITAVAGGDGDSVGVLVGMHLCGMLSLRIVALFQQTSRVRGLIVCPCCLPKSKAHPVARRAVRLNVDNYRLWCIEVANSARGMRGNSVHMLPDDDLGEVTPRCHMIIASKGPECGVQRGPAVLSRGQQIVEPKPAEVRSPLSQGRVGEDGE